MIRAIPITLKEAQEFVDKYHRHHKKAQGDKFRIGAEVDGELVGIVQVGRPVSRYLDDGYTLEVIRLCVNGDHKNVCSFLYSKSARIAKELGYHKIITYILESEMGTSLIASGWHLDAENVGGGCWSVPSRPRELVDTQLSFFEERPKYSTEKKQRYAKELLEDR